MFKQLQKKILILNMALVSVVMLSAFAIIYFVTWQNVQSENLRKLGAQEPATAINYEDEILSEDSGATVSHAISTDYSLSFSVEIDDLGNVRDINSFIDMPRETYAEAVHLVFAQDRDSGMIFLAGKDWIYKIEYSTNIQMINGIETITQDGRQISFLDVTESRLTIRNLLITLSVVGLIVLVIFYFISIFFSRSAIKPISEAWEKQKRFVADASHELKTPLTIINSNRDALMENKQETIESQVKWLDYIRIGTERMSNLISQLLVLAKLDDMNDINKREDVNVSVLALDMIRTMEAAMLDKDIQLTADIEQDVIIKSDAEKISSIISVLLDNAIKYSDKAIAVKLVKAKRHICFSIRNDGDGICQDDLPKIFDRFYRGDQARLGNGSYGLGLSIAKSLADNLDGRIAAESSLGAHTIFTVTLPF